MPPQNTVVVKTVGQTTGKGFFGFLNLIFKWGLLFVFLLIILVSAISTSFEQGSISPFLDEFVKDIFLTTVKLDVMLKQIIESQHLYVDYSGSWDQFKEIIIKSSVLFYLIYFIYTEIKLLSWVWMIGPFSTRDVWYAFQNVGPGIIVFFAMQVGYILIKTEESIAIPFIMFLHLFQAAPYIFSPLKRLADFGTRNTG